jgi:hypothetical protein
VDPVPDPLLIRKSGSAHKISILKESLFKNGLIYFVSILYMCSVIIADLFALRFHARRSSGTQSRKRV